MSFIPRFLRLQFRGCVLGPHVQPLCNWRHADLLVLQKPGTQIFAHRGCDLIGRRMFHTSTDGFLVLCVCLLSHLHTLKMRDVVNQEPDVACPVVLLVLLVGGCAALDKRMMVSTTNESTDDAVVAVGGDRSHVLMH